MKVNPKEAPPGFYATQGECRDCEYRDRKGKCKDGSRCSCIAEVRDDENDVIFKKIKKGKG